MWSTSGWPLEGGDPIAFEHDCREGICGSCGLMINGQAHGPQLGTATCQLHMRSFQDGDTIVIEPWRAAAFPVIKDLVVDRSSFDRIIEAGGYITVAPGAAPDANLTLIPKDVADAAFDAAACIGCGACVAACPNGAAQLSPRPRWPISECFPRANRSGGGGWRRWWDTMEDFFGSCTNHGECETGLPEGNLDRLHRPDEPRLHRSKFKNRRLLVAG